MHKNTVFMYAVLLCKLPKTLMCPIYEKKPLGCTLQALWSGFKFS